jgi:hypothetical protein
MSLIDRPVHLSRSAFLTAWQLAQLGELPIVVDPDLVYRTEEAAAVLRRHDLAALYDLGLATSGGELTRPWRATLDVLAHPGREFYAWSNFREADNDGALLVAESGRDAVRLITDHRSIRLEPVASRESAESLVAALPDREAARTTPMRIPKAHYDDNGREYESDDLLAEVDHEVDELRHLMRAGRDAAHQLYAATHDGAGLRFRSTPLSVLDLTGRGRVLTFVEHTGREAWVNVLPGHRANLVEALRRAGREC